MTPWKTNARTPAGFAMNSRGSHDPRTPQAVNHPWKGWPMRLARTLPDAHGTTPLGLVSLPCPPGVAGTPGYSGRTPLGFPAAWESGMGSRSRVGKYGQSNCLESELATVRAKMQTYLEELGV